GGLDVQLLRVVNGESTVLGAIRSLDYLNARWVVATISASGSTLRAQIYRVDTQQYLNSRGHWQATPMWILTRTDKAIHGGGRAGLARPANYAGVGNFDDFIVAHASAAAPTATPHVRPTAHPLLDKPTVHRPTVHKPAAHKPAAHKPAAHKPAAHKPAAHKPAAHKPAAHPIGDHTPPAVRITSPGNGSIVNQLAIVHAAATDNTGIT